MYIAPCCAHMIVCHCCFIAGALVAAPSEASSRRLTRLQSHRSTDELQTSAVCEIWVPRNLTSSSMCDVHGSCQYTSSFKYDDKRYYSHSILIFTLILQLHSTMENICQIGASNASASCFWKVHILYACHFQTSNTERVHAQQINVQTTGFKRKNK